YWLFSLVRFHWSALLAALVIIGLGLSEIVLLPLVVRLVHRRLSVAPALSIPFVWVTMERLRWLGDLYFPWFDLGYDLAPWPFLVQFADVLGVSGVGFWIVAVNVGASELWALRRDPRRGASGPPRSRWRWRCRCPTTPSPGAATTRRGGRRPARG